MQIYSMPSVPSCQDGSSPSLSSLLLSQCRRRKPGQAAHRGSRAGKCHQSPGLWCAILGPQRFEEGPALSIAEGRMGQGLSILNSKPLSSPGLQAKNTGRAWC
jgi:hypothetical protein